MLTAIMARPVSQRPEDVRATRLGRVTDEGLIDACGRLTSEIYPGLDVADEIRAVKRLKLGDTVLLAGDGAVEAFAVCHWGGLGGR
jgi:hypothetical protein